VTFRHIEYYTPATSLDCPKPDKWDSLLFALLTFLDRKKFALYGNPDFPYKWVPNTLDPQHCRTMTGKGKVDLRALEAFSTFVHNGVANITGLALAGTSVLPVEYFSGAAGSGSTV
jgi:hypothetical protein